MKRQPCVCGHDIDEHIEQRNGHVIAGECGDYTCDCKEYEPKLKRRRKYAPIK